MEENRNKVHVLSSDVMVRVLTQPPHIYFEDPCGLSSRQRRKYEETRKRKGRR